MDGLQDDRWQLDGAHKDHDAGQHGEDAGVQQQLFERDLPAVAAHEHEAEGPRHEVIHADPRCPVEHAVRAEQDLLQRQAHVAAIGKHGAVAQNAAGRLLAAADADIGKRGIQRVRCKGQQGNDAHGAQHGAVKLAAERLDDGAGPDDLQRKGRKVGNALVVENADLSAQESDSQQDNKDEDLLASRQDIAQHRIPSLCKMVSS